jgi:hypothetical protein
MTITIENVIIKMLVVIGKCLLYICKFRFVKKNIQGVIESCTDILTTSYWLHVELGKNM